MSMKYRTNFSAALLAITLLLSANSTAAQELRYDVKFEGYFDNREYSMSDETSEKSGSDFAVRLAPTVTLDFWRGNTLNVGADLVLPMGGENFEEVKAIIYYGYDSDHCSVAAGIFSRDRMMMEDYSTAFFSDDYRFNNDLVMGLMGRYFVGESYVEAACDWMSQVAVDRREIFRLLSSARKYWSALYIGYNLSVTHFAGEDNDTFYNVVDNALINPCLGARFNLGEWEFDTKLSYLQSMQRDRSFENVWLSPAMGEVALKVGYKGFSVDERFYFGDDIMPLYAGHTLSDGVVMEYGEQLYSGDIFFRSSGGFYNRAALRYDRTFFKDRMRLRAEFVTHANSDGLAYEQILDLSIRFGGKLIKNMKLE